MNSSPLVKSIPMIAAPGYVPGFDGLRALSILVVVFAHLKVSKYLPGGLGVSVFFFISGFLITRLVLAEHKTNGTISISAFFGRRMLRLLPPLLVMVGVSAFCWSAIGYSVPTNSALSCIFYFRNYYQYWIKISEQPDPTPMWEQMWSLSVEEHFYFIFPILFYLYCNRPRILISSFVILAVLSLILRMIYWVTIQEADYYCYHATETRLDAILVGCLLSVMANHYPNSSIWRAISRPWQLYACLVALVITLLIRWEYFDAVLKYSFQEIILFVFVFQLVFTNSHLFVLRLLEIRILRYIGRLSYSIYLWHLICFHIAWEFIDSALLSSVVALLLTAVVSCLSYHFVEIPMLRFRKLIAVRKRTAAASLE